MTSVPLPKKSAPAVLLIYYLCFLFVIAAGCELLSRSTWADKYLHTRSFGYYHYQFEIKWFRLQDYVKQNGGVDVIILGSSLVNTGIDPDVMAESFFEQTGVKLRIFNFGVEGFTVAPNSVIAKILEKYFHPSLFIYVTEMREYVPDSGLVAEKHFLADPWVQYESGRFNLTGWVIDHSSALEYYLPYRNWVRADFLDTQPNYLERRKDTTANGYEQDNKIGQNVDAIPDPNNPQDAEDFAAYHNFQIDPTRLINLQSILALQQRGGPKILIVEMPVHPTFYTFVGGEQVHRSFQETLRAFVETNGGSFLPAESCIDIPLNGRSNRWHLNYLGAPFFSNCLGRQLSILARQQNTDFINRNMGSSK
jgi:hypothetical protein